MRTHARVASWAAVAALTVFGCKINIDQTGSIVAPDLAIRGEATARATSRPMAAPTAQPTLAPTAAPITPDPHLPAPLVAGPDGKVPAVVQWAGLAPESGISLTVTTKREVDRSGMSQVTTTLTYKPDPPNATITLKAPPGSPGTTIAAFEMFYEYTTPNTQKAGKPPIVVGPTLVSLSPIVVPAATKTAFGASVALTLPVGSPLLNDIYKGDPLDQPGQVIANVEFKDQSGYPVQDPDLNVLKVSIPIRAL